MDRLVVDSWAWVEYLRGSEMGKKVDTRISAAGELWTTVVSLTEVVSKYRREKLSEQVPMALAAARVESEPVSAVGSQPPTASARRSRSLKPVFEEPLAAMARLVPVPPLPKLRRDV